MLEVLDLARTMEFALFEQAMLKPLILDAAKGIILASIDCDQGLEQIKYLIPQLKDASDIGNVGSMIQFVKPTSLPTVVKVYELLLKEIIGKRRNNNAKFFAAFVRGFIWTLSDIICREECIERYLAILKSCLKWRFVVLDGDWRRELLHDAQIVSLFDETIRDIIYHRGFRINNDCVKIISDRLNKGCTVNFRKACEKYLFSSEYISDSDEDVIAAREACRKRSEIQDSVAK
ncbi:hypothetical protein MP638_001245 [Amoeboaphelidium occidentale]|nr:hypothetical protein MP638_001245 [Amoeboaphelidium occidentale]